MSEKDFSSWSDLKIKLDQMDAFATFQERDVWWASVGMNIGSEMYGKEKLFLRPVLIVKKYSHNTFFSVPFTSKCKNKKYYYNFEFKDKPSSLLLNQGKTMDVRRLVKKIGTVSEERLANIKHFLIEGLK